jgi:hypothetical protein
MRSKTSDGLAPLALHLHDVHSFLALTYPVHRWGFFVTTSLVFEDPAVETVFVQ